MRPAPLALGFAFALLGCGRAARVEPSRDAAPAEAPRASEVSVDPSLVADGRVAVAPTQRRALRGDLRLPAEVVSSAAGAAEVSSLCAGRVASIEAREGDKVKRGQVLAWLDSQEAARLVSEAVRARARAEAAQRRLDRQEALARDRATSAAAVDDARTDLSTARAEAAAARTLLAAVGLWEPPAGGDGPLPSRAPLRSPIDGVVTERLVALGAPVTPDKVLFRVVASEHVVVDGLWADPSAPPPPPGTLVALHPRGRAAPSCAGRVVAALAVVEASARARRLRVSPSGPCAFLLPGAFVDMTVTSEDAAPALALARGAVVEVRGASMVFVATSKPGAFLPRAVRLGASTSDDVAVLDGLAEGERVVVVGSVLLKGELLRAELESP
ncbi:MAG TPA: efflux RND transporter periplasmic adaptor subunit [Polyangiaceae bacterium]|nr:efflux RND transporter periplasmic adaptor subunit [Polyangiaceae bacterium]